MENVYEETGQCTDWENVLFYENGNLLWNQTAQPNASNPAPTPTQKILNWSKILTEVNWKLAASAPEYTRGNVKVNNMMKLKEKNNQENKTMIPSEV